MTDRRGVLLATLKREHVGTEKEREKEREKRGWSGREDGGERGWLGAYFCAITVITRRRRCYSAHIRSHDQRELPQLPPALATPSVTDGSFARSLGCIATVLLSPFPYFLPSLPAHPSPQSLSLSPCRRVRLAIRTAVRRNLETGDSTWSHDSDKRLRSFNGLLAEGTNDRLLHWLLTTLFFISDLQTVDLQIAGNVTSGEIDP